MVDTRCLIIDNDLDLSDRKVRKICRKYINKYAAFIHDHYSDNKVTSSSDVYRNEVNFSIIIDDFKKKILNELKMQENIIANYIISVSYSSVSISKSLAWSAYGDYIIENLKNNTNPKRNISIREVPYKTDDSYEYLGNETFLYEIIEDYKEAANNEVKDEIFNSFCSSIWASDNKRRTYIKTIHFKVRKDLLDTELGRVFDIWSGIEYRYYKSMTKDENWCSIIRQKINNIYTRYFDKEVILNKEYMDLLKKPKLMYFDWLSGTEMDADTVTDIIDDTIDKAEKLKQRFQMEKMTLSWNEYKKVIEGFLRRCFDNCKLIEEYEDKTQIVNNYDFITEDHFYIKYICERLNGNIKDYQKKYYGLKYSSRKGYSRCKCCGGIIEKTGNKRLYCCDCALIKKKESNRKADKI